MVVMGWCLWLLGVGLLAWLVDGWIPAARWMVLLAVVGLMLVWPAIRLSEGGMRLTLPAVWVEWLCLILVFQAVVWLLRALSGWRMDQTVWLDAAVAAWSLLTAAVVGLGVRWPRAWPRTVAMVLCALLVLGEPLAVALVSLVWPAAARPIWSMHLSPLPTVWALAHPVVDVTLGPWPERVMFAAAGAVTAWVVVVIFKLRVPDF